MKLYPFYLKSVAKAAKYELELRLPFLDGVWYFTTATRILCLNPVHGR